VRSMPSRMARTKAASDHRPMPVSGSGVMLVEWMTPNGVRKGCPPAKGGPHQLASFGDLNVRVERRVDLKTVPAVAELMASIHVTHDADAENRGLKTGDWARLASRVGETTLRVLVTDRVAPGVVYTTFHHPSTQANVVTTDFSDWATNCPEYKVTAVQVMPSNGPSDWQEEYEELSRQARRVAEPLIAAE